MWPELSPVNSGGYRAIYNHGNETDLHAPYLFNYAGKPWLTQYWVRRIMDEFYGATPEKGYGYGQDDDQGQLSGWFVLSAMGILMCAAEPVVNHHTR